MSLLLPSSLQSSPEEDSPKNRNGIRVTRNMGRIPKPELHTAVVPVGDTAAAWRKAIMLLSADGAVMAH